MNLNLFLILIYIIVLISIENSKFFCLNSKIIKKNHIYDALTLKNNDTLNKRKLSNITCTLKYCLKCEKRNECSKCKEGYELYNHRCYYNNCEIFGFCKYCDDYDCLKCHKGYKLNYGICDKKEQSIKLIILKIAIPIIIIFLIIYLYLYKKKKAKEKVETGQVIKFVHPKSGYYRINFDKYNNINSGNEENQEFSQNKSLSSSNSDSNGDKESPEVNVCVVCGGKKTYTIADCGCSLCLDDYKIIKGEKERIKCRIHNVFLSSNISFEMYIKSNIKGHGIERIGLKKCLICKINDGTQSFNCGCPMRVCQKCFNDNIYVFKYNQCPGCGIPYTPLENKKKKKKSLDEKISK